MASGILQITYNCDGKTRSIEFEPASTASALFEPSMEPGVYDFEWNVQYAHWVQYARISNVCGCHFIGSIGWRCIE